MPELVHGVIVMWLGHIFLSWAEGSRAIVANGGYALAAEQSTGVLSGVPGCPGLPLDPDVLWSKTDALSDEEAE